MEMGYNFDFRGKRLQQISYSLFWQNEEGSAKCPVDLEEKKERSDLSPYNNFALIIISCYRNGEEYIRTHPFIHLSTNFSNTYIFKTVSTVSDTRDKRGKFSVVHFPARLNIKGYNLHDNDMRRGPVGSRH